MENQIDKYVPIPNADETSSFERDKFWVANAMKSMIDERGYCPLSPVLGGMGFRDDQWVNEEIRLEGFKKRTKIVGSCSLYSGSELKKVDDLEFCDLGYLRGDGSSGSIKVSNHTLTCLKNAEELGWDLPEDLKGLEGFLVEGGVLVKVK
jgi:hypothetical protein